MSEETGEKTSTDDRGAEGRIERLTAELDRLNLPPDELSFFGVCGK